jgi:hypothetical protein
LRKSNITNKKRSEKIYSNPDSQKKKNRRNQYSGLSLNQNNSTMKKNSHNYQLSNPVPK